MQAKLSHHLFVCSSCNKHAKARSKEFDGKEHVMCSLTPKGRLRYVEDVHRIIVTDAEMFDHGNGACLACGAEVPSGIEPDARGYLCKCCGRPRVYGLEELAIMGFLDVEGDGDE
jgi:hypothetical protein